MNTIQRHSLNPVLSAKDVPYDASLVFNAGVAKWQGRYVMLFRNDYGQTEQSWRAIHAVRRSESDLYSWEGGWRKEYLAGLMLLDLEDPSKVIGMSREPLVVPEADYETKGFRGNVIFPGGMILEDDGEVKIYYGAADTVECLATANVDDLLAACGPAR